MKEVFVLFGRKSFHEGVFDHDGNYFKESPVLEVFESFDAAFEKFKVYAVEAYNFLKSYGDLVIDTHFMEETTEEDIFRNYNCGYEDKDEIIENDICWMYRSNGKDNAYWQVEAFNVPIFDQVPIMPGLFIKICSIN